MEISIIQAILIGIVYYMGTNGNPWPTVLGSYIIRQPIVGGTLVGLILGDPVQGCIIGAAINLPYIAFITAGGALPSDAGLAGTLGTAVALASGLESSVAIAIAVPIGLLGTIIWVTHMTVDVTFVHMADKAAEEGNLDKICFLHIIPPQIFMFIICVIPVTLGAYYGGDIIKSIINLLQGTPLHVMSIIGGMLPALGIAMNMSAMGRKGTLLFFILGFAMSVYFNLGIIAVAIFATIISYFHAMNMKEVQ
ncbi:PTS mannose/fructose/sorbose/N-acetylgalactosamine transporter subunit IIC [Propionispora hippei]|uniref:PTS system, mannose-specific IIC component n=1 Tax=Propionispora hippei DSM 15287 TaxID=1123003 RepID=A0A1M6DP36_9FIRM|nr:PTS sugar transporter subunit IIC [Propionispora hippei]SHI74987.1 PTS system, mannose-specific IIC component [Propionispora hippei DSM 15287]